MSRHCPHCGKELVRIDELIERRASELLAEYKKRLTPEQEERLPDFWGCSYCWPGRMRLILPGEFMRPGELEELLNYLSSFEDLYSSERARQKAGHKLFEEIAKTIQGGGKINKFLESPAVKITVVREALEDYRNSARPINEILKELCEFIERYRDQLIMRGFTDPAKP